MTTLKINLKKKAKIAKAATEFRKFYDNLSDDERSVIFLMALVKKNESAKKVAASKKKAVKPKAGKEVTEEEEDDDSIPETFTDAMRKEIIKDTIKKLKLISLTVAPEDYERVLPS